MALRIEVGNGKLWTVVCRQLTKKVYDSISTVL